MQQSAYKIQTPGKYPEENTQQVNVYCAHQCRYLNCCYEGRIMFINCDLRANNFLCHFDVLQESIQEHPEDGVDKGRNATEL